MSSYLLKNLAALYVGYEIGKEAGVLLSHLKPVKPVKKVSKQELEEEITEYKNSINTTEIVSAATKIRYVIAT